MAYSYWHRDGGRPPPPPYSKHKYHASTAAGPSGSTATNNSFTGDSKFSSELFKDMSRKIAHLTKEVTASLQDVTRISYSQAFAITLSSVEMCVKNKILWTPRKVVCALTNKAEDQELTLQSSRSEYEEKVKNLQSELQKKTEDYKNKIRVLELQLQEEQKHSLKKEEELKTLKQFRAFAESCRSFKEPLIRSSKDKTSISGSGNSEDLGKLRLELGLERSSANLYFDTKLIFPSTEGVKNGGSEFTFIGNKLRDMESYEKEVRFLIDACERLKAERMALRTKCESEFLEIEEQNSQGTNGKEGVLFGSSDGEKRLSEISFKEQLEKQDLQYRKRISELLQCLTQSENRAEKYKKEIKQLEDTLSSKEKQNSMMTGELSRTLEYLRLSRNANAEIQEVCSKQSQEILTKNDLIAKIQDEIKNYEHRLSSMKSENEQFRASLQKSEGENFRLQQLIRAKETDFKEIQLLKDQVANEQKKSEQIQKDLELRIKSIANNHDEEKRKLEENIDTLTRSSLLQEKKFLQQLQDTKMCYDLHMEEERLVHREIQDNLEQQLDLLHRNVQHTIRNEEEEVATLHLLLGDKEVSLNKSQKQLKEARETADRMRRLIKLKEMELEKIREQQKIQHSTEVRITVESSPPSSAEDKWKNTTREFPLVLAVSDSDEEEIKFLKGRIEFLEDQNKVLRMEKVEILKEHLIELEKQSEAHKEELERLKLELKQESLQNAQDEEEITTDGKLQDYSNKTEIESCREKCPELQETVKKLEEDSLSEKEKLRCELNAERDQVKKLTSLVETLQIEHGRVVSEREAKMNEVLRVRTEASQQIKNLENYWQERLVRELKKASHSFESEKQKLVSHFNKAQRLLKDKIVLLQSIVKDLKERKLKQESEEDNMEAFQELHKTISEKDATITKLKEEKKALHGELLNLRDNSSKTCSNEALSNSIENMFALKKPRLERPPLTPQLVRRHSLLGSSEQKWLRARSQSPMRGFPAECTSKPTLAVSHVHRSSWTGEMDTDLLEVTSLKDDNGANLTSTSKRTDSVNDPPHPTENLNLHKEQTEKTKSEQEKYSNSQHPHDSLSSHICDTIAECDELLMTIEEDEKQSTLPLNEQKSEVKDWTGNPIMESEV